MNTTRRTQRSIALFALLAAIALMAVAFPFRAAWWGEALFAVAEAAVVGGVADWFAVTALFRRPLGLPIPHTALIASNWELLARRVGTMVGDRILTRTYVEDEISKIDLDALLERLASRIGEDDILNVTSTAARWFSDQLSKEAIDGMAERLRAALGAWPLAPALATALDVARQHGWDERAVAGTSRALANVMDSPHVRSAVDDIIGDALSRYRSGLSAGARFFAQLADVLGVIDRDKIVRALYAGIHQIAIDPGHPLRREVTRLLAGLPGQLRDDPELASRVELLKVEFLMSTPANRLLGNTVDELRLWLVQDLRADHSESARWLAARLEEWRAALMSDHALRRNIDTWAKAWSLQLIDRYHGQVSAFIEKGVRALGPEGAVRLIEEHAGDDLQYIRVNGTVVGGLAGGALYVLTLLLEALGR